MVLFQLLTLDIPYQEVEKSWKISECVLKGIPPQFPPLGAEYQSLITIFQKCTHLSPLERIKASDLCKQLSVLQLQLS